MPGENDLLFDMSPFESDRKQAEKSDSGLKRALQRLDSTEERLLKNLENRAFRGERLTAADYRALQDLRQRLENRRQDSLPDHVVRTAKDVAERFGRTVRTVRNWAGRGMPQLPDGYDLIAIQTWALEEGVIKSPVLDGGSKAQGPDSNGGDEAPSQDRAYFELRVKQLDAELKELKLQKETGLLINRHEVEKEWQDRAFEFKRDLLSMARRLSLRGANKAAPELYEIIRSDCMNTLWKYSRGKVEVDQLEVPDGGHMDG